MSYFILTGATGLLGRYLLRDLTLAGLSLAVVARRNRFESSRQRIETAMAYWEQQLGRSLVRPVVLEGDIAEPQLGLCVKDRQWVARHGTSMIHSAASLTFQADSRSGEPWRSNVEGTRNVIALCDAVGIRRMHYVSTAYVCGSRRGRILESELDVGQTLGNDYEQSKVTAEKEVRAANAFDEVTCYRPSIIVGDSRTGFTTSYHGFYTPLRLVYSLLQSVPWETIVARDWLGQLQLDGHERKNLVSVEWVSAAMANLIVNSDCHGATYHLTNPQPATALAMREAMTDVLAERVREDRVPRATPAQDDFLAAFRDQMGVYRSYWSDDPQFDSTNTQRALPDLACPEIDHAVMARLVRYAIDSNFGWPRETPRIPQVDVNTLLAAKGAADRAAQPGRYTSAAVNLCITGPGGGQWNLLALSGRVIEAAPGLRDDAVASCYLATSTFADLVRGSLALEDAIHTGRLVVAGNSLHYYELARLFSDLRSDEQTPLISPQSATIG
jgi:thioester reductase-like protein